MRVHDSSLRTSLRQALPFTADDVSIGARLYLRSKENLSESDLPVGRHNNVLSGPFRPPSLQ